MREYFRMVGLPWPHNTLISPLLGSMTDARHLRPPHLTRLVAIFYIAPISSFQYLFVFFPLPLGGFQGLGWAWRCVATGLPPGESSQELEKNWPVVVLVKVALLSFYN